MNFIDISTLNIATELNVLKRGTQTYSIFLYQHSGVLFANTERIGNNNTEETETKFLNILTKAKAENISLVVSPEYSCPFSIILKIINDVDIGPSNGKLWVLGGESLNKEQLQNLFDLNNENLLIHFEHCYKNSEKLFVDPLYYIFKGQHNGSEKLIILVQFKSNHMGGLWTSQLEPDNLIQGNDVYILKNNQNSVRLMSFICSQAMNFDARYEQDLIENHSWTDSPFLFLNLQFNPNPSHRNFIAFKDFVLNKERRELITLNWGYDTTFLSGDKLYKEYNAPRSGIYFKTSDKDLDYKSKKIIDNHNKGLYFLQIKRNKRVYFLKRNIDLFEIDNKSVNIYDGVDEQQRREGPTVRKIYDFDAEFTLNDAEVDKNIHIEFLNQRGLTNAYFLNPDNSIIDKERLLNISTGMIEVKEGSKWSDIIHLNSFTLNEFDECNNRLTYTEDNYACSEAVRNSNFSKINELDKIILPNNSLYPHSIKRLGYKDLKLAYSNDAFEYYYRHNVVNQDNIMEKATICYIGNASDRDVKSTYDELQKLFEKGNAGKDTIVVYYMRSQIIEQKSYIEAGSITQTPTDDNSILS